MSPPKAPSYQTAVAVLVVLIVAVSVAAAAWSESQRSLAPSAGPRVGIASVEDLTPRLGEVFSPGAIQGFGANDSSIFLAGIGVWNRPIGLTLPVIASLGASGTASNVTPSVETYFEEGGVFGSVWNGTDWMLSGEATWGSLNEGVLITGSGDHWTNLTPLVGSYFLDGGLWAVGWNGSGWLLGGNTSHGASLVSYDHGVVHDLTSLLTDNDPGYWIQLMVWNGSAWMLGGKGVFGTYSNGAYTDLMDESPFTDGGAYAADWNGSAWLVGGGPAAAIVVVEGASVQPGPALPSTFNLWPGSVIWTPAGWLVAGKGGGSPPWSGTSTPELCVWPSDQVGATVDDLSGLLPPSFEGGQVQFAWWSPLLGSNTILLVGQGSLDAVSGYSDGAIALLRLG